MTRTLTCMTLALALLTPLLWAGTNGSEQPADPVEFGFRAPSPTDDNICTILFQFNATQAIGGNNNYLQGVAFAGGYFWISSAGANIENSADNRIYKLSSLGVLVDSFPQPDVGSGKGFIDLTWDGTYIYGACGECPYLVAWDLNGRLMPSMYVPKPPNTSSVQGLAYNPILDHFWLGSSTALWEFDRQGNTIWQGTVGPSSYQRGIAYDYGVGGPFLWMFDAYNYPASTLRKFNPITHSLISTAYQISQFTGCGSQVAGGLEATHEYLPAYWALVGLALGTPNDWCFVWEIRNYMDPQAPAAPIGFTVTPNGPEPMATLAWTNPTLNAGGTTLTSIRGIIITREGVIIDTIPGYPGEVMSHNDVVPNPADWDYHLNIYNEHGMGSAAYAGDWIGLDSPSNVTFLHGEGVGDLLIAHLSWDNPTTGWHGGYFTQDSITGYIIERYDQLGHLQVTFNPAGLLTSYNDSTVIEHGFYNYKVKVGNSTGWSYPVQTGLFQVGPGDFVVYPYYWVELRDVGINTGITERDQNVGPFDLGFNYNLYGTSFDNIRICSNGFASFTSTSTTSHYEPIPSVNDPNNLIAPLWTFLRVGIFDGTVWYLADTLNQRFIVEWDSLAAIGDKEWIPAKFEALIYDNGTIDFMYQVYPYISWWAGTIGIENGSGTQGVQCSYNGSGPFIPANNTGVRFLNQSTTPPGIVVTLTPTALPILIPANGGSFSYYFTVVNSETAPHLANLWVKEILPDSSVLSPLLGPVTINLPIGTRTWLRTQNVPATAPSGDYTYIGIAGLYPDMIWSQSSFPFTKLATGDGPRVENWSNWGDRFTEEPAAASVIPLTFTLKGIYPNPFNPTTTLSYELPDASLVNLSVYDISGRKVAELVNGMQTAGSHEALFDGSGLPSGVYLYKLTMSGSGAMPTMLSGKMVLLK